MPMPSDMYGAVSDRSGSDGAEEPIAEYIAKAYCVTHSLQTMRFFIAWIRSAGYICLYGFLLAGGDGVDSNSQPFVLRRDTLFRRPVGDYFHGQRRFFH